MVRLTRVCSAVLIVGSVLAACGSDSPSDSNTSSAAASDDTSTVAVSVSGGSETIDTSAPPPEVTAPVPAVTEPEAPAETSDDLCSSIPDLVAIETAIGEAAKDPLGIGEAGSQQTCTLSRASDDFPGITFTATPERTIAAQIEFVKTNYQIDIVPLEGADGFFAGEGDSVYYEANGTLYQTSATVAGDSRAAALNLMRAWLGL